MTSAGISAVAQREEPRRRTGQKPTKRDSDNASSEVTLDVEITSPRVAVSKSETRATKTDPASASESVEQLPEPIVRLDDDERIQVIRYDGVSLADAMRLFSEETGKNVVCSADAGQKIITAYLRNVTPLDALEAIVKSNGLFYRLDENSGIVRIATSDEYEKDLSSFREEQTRVFTLLYPNPAGVAQVIAQVFGDRVEMNTADTDTGDLVDLSQRFNRFDLVDGRSLGLGTFETDETNSAMLGRNGLPLGAQFGLGQNPIGSSISNRSRRRSSSTARQPDPTNRLAGSEIQELENELSSNGQISDEARARLMRRREATIYVSTIRRNNQVVVRTADPKSMVEIEQLVAKLDVPTPTVLLEVKVLRVNLADGINSAFEYFVGDNNANGAFSDGNLAPTFPGGNGVSRILADGLGVSGAIPGALTFQVVDSNFQFRMQMLESRNRVTALATPLILTANNEVSRIFVGDTLPFTVGFTPSQVVGGLNAVSGAVAATPITELRDVGQSLLITPNINADRTVTLRVVEENSERVLGGASIPVPDVDGTSVTSVQVDTVRRRSLSGTVVAQDGMAVAMGGLIEEHESDANDQVPLLGDLPGFGFLFRRESITNSRSELIVVIRPYVFTTPSESVPTTQTVLGELSTHAESLNVVGTPETYVPYDPVRSDAECLKRAQLFQFHNVHQMQ
ncbi:MAG: type II secretion system protein GspD [Planctomycetales bacterium]|nr:type II secretion system protein GspD [Planctomycetales bacterium]